MFVILVFFFNAFLYNPVNLIVQEECLFILTNWFCKRVVFLKQIYILFDIVSGAGRVKKMDITIPKRT